MAKKEKKTLTTQKVENAHYDLDRKTTNFNMRMSPKLKAVLMLRAAKMGVSLAELVEMMITTSDLYVVTDNQKNF